jgi:hypothetical protein
MSASLLRAPPDRPPSALLTTFNATRPVQYATFGTTEASGLLLRYSSRLGSSDTVERRAERVEVRQFLEGAARPPSERLARHRQRDPTGAVRNFWDYRGLMPPSKVLVKIGIERHGSRSAKASRAPPDRPPSAWLTTFNATRSVQYATFGLPRLEASF